MRYIKILFLCSILLGAGCASTIYVDPGQEVSEKEIAAAIDKCHREANVVRHLLLFPLSLGLNEMATDESVCQPRIKSSEGVPEYEKKGYSTRRLTPEARRLFDKNDCGEFNPEVEELCRDYKEGK